MKKDTSSGKRLRVPCCRCDHSTWHQVIASIDDDEEELLHEDGSREEDPITISTSYQIIQCQGCEEVSFRRYTGFSRGGGEQVDLYPGRKPGLKPVDMTSLPIGLLDVYRETHTAMCNEQLILAALGIRAVVERVCRYKGATGKSLEKKVDDLVDLRILTQDGAAILHKVRDLGNKAAHDDVEIDEREIEAAMEVLDHLLKTVYILPQTVEQLAEKRSKP